MSAVLNTPHTRTTAEWQAADAAHYLHPFTDFKGLANKGSRVITKADNIYLWDSDGKKILDAMSGLWCVNVGYGERALIDAATKQLETLPFYNAFFQTATPPAIELAELLAEVTPPQFQHVFFSGSGSEGNDTVVRMVRRYWDLLGQPQRKVIISRHNAYHGSTMAGASLGGMSGMHAQGDLPIPNITHIEQPYYYEKALPGETPDAFGVRPGALVSLPVLLNDHDPNEDVLSIDPASGVVRVGVGASGRLPSADAAASAATTGFATSPEASVRSSTSKRRSRGARGAGSSRARRRRSSTTRRSGSAPSRRRG